MSSDDSLGRSAFHLPKLSQITDGLSKTLLLSESPVGEVSRNLRFGTARFSGYGNGSPLDCYSRDGSPTATILTGANGDSQPGYCWPCQATNSMYVAYTGFVTMFPPNGPRCASSGWSDAIVPAGSYHSGGVNVAMCDGSVRFIVDGIDYGTGSGGFGAINPDVASSCGVWGRLSSARGGEIIGAEGY
jgi:prepilin-type processing-associated H-X9-DG protein